MPAGCSARWWVPSSAAMHSPTCIHVSALTATRSTQARGWLREGITLLLLLRYTRLAILPRCWEQRGGRSEGRQRERATLQQHLLCCCCLLLLLQLLQLLQLL